MGFTIRELESGSIEVERGGTLVSPSKPALREMALALNIGLLNAVGNPLTTRQLGSQIIRSVEQLSSGTQIAPDKADPFPKP